MRRFLSRGVRFLMTSALGDEFVYRDGAAMALKRNAQLKEMMHMMESTEIIDRKEYIKLVWACTDNRALKEGIRVHQHLVGSGWGCDTFMCTCLITMYGKCRSVGEARKIFDSMYTRNVFTWTAMITAYAQNGYHREALCLFEEMDVMPNSVTLLTCVTACNGPGFLENGRRLHAMIRKNGFDKEMNVANSLLNMYARCGGLEDAEKFYGQMPERNVITWNSMLTAYAQNGHYNKALFVFRLLLNEGFELSSITFLSILNACTSPQRLEAGKWIHGLIAEMGYLPDLSVGSALITMYARCDSFQDARKTFDKLLEKNVVIYTSMITACSQRDQCEQALDIFRRMQHEGVLPNEVTLASVISACVTLLALREGTRIHRLILESGLFKATLVMENALMDLHGKCGDLEDAFKIFRGMERRDVLSWTTMLTVCAQGGFQKMAIHLFKCMRQEGLNVDETCYAGVIGACSDISELSEGRRIYFQIIESGYSTHSMVGNAVMDMFSKCGCPDEALSIFDQMHWHDVVTWNALISSFAQHGYERQVPKLFCKMQQEGSKPDDVTFVALLSACSHAGLVKQGCDYFVSLEREYPIVPSSENYGCLVDLVARAGYLTEAEKLIYRFPDGIHRIIPWTALLSACRLYKDVDRAKRASHVLSKLDPHISSSQIVLSNVYTESLEAAESS